MRDRRPIAMGNRPSNFAATTKQGTLDRYSCCAKHCQAFHNTNIKAIPLYRKSRFKSPVWGAGETFRYQYKSTACPARLKVRISPSQKDAVRHETMNQNARNAYAFFIGITPFFMWRALSFRRLDPG